MLSLKGRSRGQTLGDKFANRVEVPKERQFIGLDAYQKLIDSVDVVLLATPPGFRPRHLRAAVEAGKHIFCEKPMAVGCAGSPQALETVRNGQGEETLARRRLLLALATASRARCSSGSHDGAIGDLTSSITALTTRAR